MGVVQLSFVLRLNALVVEDGVDGVGVGRLRAAIESHAPENFVVVAEVVINAAAEQPLFVAIGNGLRPALRASAVLQRRGKAREIEASATPRGIIGRGDGVPDGSADPRRAVV